MAKADLVFTVVTVTYNAGSTIQRTLESVASQTYPCVEHLVVDGCSSDDTMSVLRNHVENNPKAGRTLRLLREPDKGLYDAMNKGIAQAHGNYIIFLNAGDTFHEPTTLEQVAGKIIGFRRGLRPAVIYGETDLVDNEGRFLRHRRLTTPSKLTWRSFINGMRVCHQSFYVRADLARAEQYDLHWRFSADFDWCVRILHRAGRRHLPIFNTNLILTDYLSEGMTTANHSASLKERMRIMAHHYGWPLTLAAHLWFCVRAVPRIF